MSEYRWLDDDDDDEDEKPSALQEARKAAKSGSRRNKELETELATLRSQLRDRVVRDAIKEKNLNPKIAKLVPKDLDLDDLEGFITEFADVFPASQEGVTATDAEGQKVVDPNLQAIQQVQEGSQSATPLTGDLSQMLAQIQAAQDPESLNLLIHGNKHGPSMY
jgi:hypothetical protein